MMRDPPDAPTTISTWPLLKMIVGVEDDSGRLPGSSNASPQRTPKRVLRLARKRPWQEHAADCSIEAH